MTSNPLGRAPFSNSSQGSQSSEQIAALSAALADLRARLAALENAGRSNLLGGVPSQRTLPPATLSARTVRRAAKQGRNFISADQIAAGAVVAEKIAVAALSAISANLGTITAGLLEDPSATVTLDLDSRLLTIKDGSGVTRVLLGEVASGTYGLQVFDASGTKFIDETGVVASTIDVLATQNAPAEAGATQGADWFGNLSDLPQNRRNLVHHGKFDEDTVGSGVSSWNNGVVAAVTGESEFQQALKVTAAAGSSNADFNEPNNTFNVQGGERVYVEGWLDASGAPSAAAIGLGLKITKADGSHRWPTLPATPGTGWTFFSGFLTINSGEINAIPYVEYHPGSPATSEYVQIANFVIYQGNLDSVDDGTTYRRSYVQRLSNVGAIQVDGSGSPIAPVSSSTDASNVVTISVAAHTVKLGGSSISYNSGSHSGGLTHSTTYYVYCDDPTLAGGAVTYSYTTNKGDLGAAVGRYYVGKTTTPAGASSSGSGDGAGGGMGGLF